MKSFKTIFFLAIFLSIFGCKEKSDNKQGVPVDANASLEIMEKGKEIASETFLALSSELKKAMTDGGVDHALTYCNVNALSITDSLSKEHGVHIKRTSMKVRNPQNAPSEKEEEMLLHFDNRKNNGIVMAPRVLEDKEKYTFHAPIVVQDMCIKCHGPKEKIDSYNKIIELYPEDMAYGYAQGDLRGMWTIEFRK